MTDWSIHTVFLPRENLVFLEEWLLYHFHIGAKSITLYDNTGSRFVDVGNCVALTGRNRYGIDISKFFPSFTDEQVRAATEEICARFENKVKIVDWRPMKNGEITYGQPEACVHYCLNAPRSDWTFYTDIDEFIVIKPGLDIRAILGHLETEGVTSVKLLQRKFYCRFMGLAESRSPDNYLLTSEFRTLDIDTRKWAPKLAVKNAAFDVCAAGFSIHDLPTSYGICWAVNPEMFYFHHYNVNPVQIEWLRKNLHWIDPSKSFDDLSKFRVDAELKWFEAVAAEYRFAKLPR